MSSEQLSESTYNDRSRGSSPLLVFVTILVIILVVGAILGFTLLYRQAVTMNARLDALERRFAHSEVLVNQSLDDLREQSDEQQETLAGVEERLATVETSQADLADEQGEVIDDVEVLQEELPELSKRLATIESDLQAIETIKDTLQANLDILRGELESASSLLGDFSLDADAISEEIAGINQRWDEVKADMQMLEAMELLTRGQILLGQGDTRQAQTELENARDMLEGLSGKVSDYQQELILELTERLDEVLARITISPISAAEILEEIWTRLLTSLQE